LPIGIYDHKIGLLADDDGAFACIATTKLGWPGRNQLHKAIHAEPTLRDSSGIDQAHAMFNPGPAVGNFREIVFAEFLLFLEAEWTVISGDDLQMVLLQSFPEFFLVPFFSQ